ncbi:MAG: class I SAM-dependent methyltransferase [Candidatus Angelobacter sp.]
MRKDEKSKSQRAINDLPSDDERTFWNKKYDEGPHKWLNPDPFLAEAYSEFLSGVTPGIALDLAGGGGRHTLWLAERGWHLTLMDVSDVGVALARKTFENHLPFTAPVPRTKLVDLTSFRDLGKKQFDLIVVFYYLQRELFSALISALKPGAHLIYKTYTIEQLRLQGGPGHSRFLLQPNELLRAFSSLRILYYRERTKDKAVAELVAVKGSEPPE